ncbi:hypothetical protein GF389_01450 [Candidatus Dojkabacteria bacterium]|nr:hypothetical protein [Candidatus Dojkabacteria bacterium]
MKNTEVEGFWVKMNRDFQTPNSEDFRKIMSHTKKPVSAYKVFSQKGGFDLNSSMSFIVEFPGVKSVVVGVANVEQATETISGMHNYIK